MKNALFTLGFFLLLGFAASAQAPQAFKYQAVVRDAAGQVLANQSVGLRIRLTPADTTMTLYTETHTATTNAFGLVNLNVGRGTVVSGQFGTIDWAQPVYIHLGLDVNGGAAYEEMGTSELLSVPYALYAANAAGGNGLPANATTGDLLYYDGTAWQRLPAGAPGAVLTMGDAGLPIWFEPRQDFYGSYTATETCNGINISWTMTISAQNPGNSNEVITNNIGDYGITLPGTVDGNVLTINATDPGTNITLNGTFTLTGNMLSFTYVASNVAATDNCTGTATRQ